MSRKDNRPTDCSREVSPPRHPAWGENFNHATVRSWPTLPASACDTATPNTLVERFPGSRLSVFHSACPVFCEARVVIVR